MVAGTLSTLQQLVSEREVTLPDGVRLMSQERYQALKTRHRFADSDLKARGILPIHASFRIIGLARPTGAATRMGATTGGWREWLTPELQTMFMFVHVPPLEAEEQRTLLTTLAPGVPPRDVDRLMKFSGVLREAIRQDDMLATLLPTVSLRNSIRICKRIASALEAEASAGLDAGADATTPPNEALVSDGDGAALHEEGSESVPRAEADLLHDSILSASLSRFLPPLVHETLFKLLEDCQIFPSPPPAQNLTIEIEPIVTSSDEVVRGEGSPVSTLTIGPISVPIYPARDPLLVPDILFFDNPRQTLIMMEMLKDWTCGQHLLLIGNQGVGKNKMADRMLQLLQLPREYIQLHRDTTVQNLTSNPTIVGGVLTYEDSPLVRAAREGRILVVDEADKAPTYVTAILKALVEDRSMLLADGRRIVDAEEMEGFPPSDREHIALHPDFRVIALANRPGFPFHGNDFFREVGDVFACHAIDNPDAESELYLLRRYGPDVPLDTLKKLIGAFDELRNLSDDGQLSYPYSTRELAAVVKHMQAYSNDGVEKILRNVFDFDNYTVEEKDILTGVFAKHGIPFAMGTAAFHVTTGRTSKLAPPRLVEMWELAERSGGAPLETSTQPLPSVLRENHGSKNSFWSLKPSQVDASLRKKERSGAIFSEEVYSFHLPQSLIVGAVRLVDGSIVSLGRAQSFVMHIVDPAHTRCATYDLHSALPADGMYRTAPKLAPCVALDRRRTKLGLDFVTVNPSSGLFMAVDVSGRRVVFTENLPTLVRGADVHMVSTGATGATADEVLLYQRGEQTISVFDFVQNSFTTVRVPFALGAVHALGRDTWVVTSKNPIREEEAYYLVSRSSLGQPYRLERLSRQHVPASRAEGPGERVARADATSPYSTLPSAPSDPARLAPGTETVSMAPNTFARPPGALRTSTGGTEATRFLHLRRDAPATEEGGMIHSLDLPTFALGLPQAFDRGQRARLYAVESVSSGTLSDAPRLQARGSYAVHLPQSDLVGVVRESLDVFEVEIEIFDLDRGMRRVLTVGLEDDDALGAAGVVGRGAPGTGMSASSLLRTGSSSSLSMSSNKPLTALTPAQLNMFSMRRSSVSDAAQRLFVVELSSQAIMTVDCMGWARVWIVDELAVRQAFADWRKLVGKADDAPLSIV